MWPLVDRRRWFFTISGDEAAAARAARRRGGPTVVQEIERLLTITELSEMLGLPVDTLDGWRHRGQGPQGYRVGRHVRYRLAAAMENYPLAVT